MNKDRITYFAQTDYRNKKVPFGIKSEDRARHFYVIGKTGMGKSTVLENLAAQDIQNGEGLAVIDPHGSFAEKMLEYVPEHRINDVVYFAPFDLENPVAFNVMENIGADKRHLVASGLMSTFKKIWADAWSARMEYILNNTILALLEYPDATLLSVNKMLSDKNFRNKVLEHVTDVAVKSFWVDEFAKYTERMAAEAVPAIQNKIGQFTANPLIRNMIGQSKSSFDIRDMMDNQKILIINLSKGRIGEQNANLLGGMLITKIYLAAMSRADLDKSELDKLPFFYLHVDEFQSFASDSFADILSEARKYKLALSLAHQYVEQMSEQVKAAVFGNVGTMVTFRVGSADAEIFEREYSPIFTAEDMVNLGFAQIYLRLMINGVGSKPFSAVTLPPLPKLEKDFKQEVTEASRKNYGRKREIVEESIRLSLMSEEVTKKKPDYVPKTNLIPKTENNTQDSLQKGKEVFTSPKKDTPPTHQPLKSALLNIFNSEKREFVEVKKVEPVQNKVTTTSLPETKKIENVNTLSVKPQNSFPPKNTQTTSFVKKENPLPAPHSPKMKEILDLLEKNDMAEIVSVPKKEINIPKVVSLADLKKPDKGPSEDKINALKEKMKSLSSQVPPPPPQPKKVESPDIVKPIIQDKKVSEVPEEVLKKVLNGE
jgi:hypothetical protein